MPIKRMRKSKRSTRRTYRRRPLFRQRRRLTSRVNDQAGVSESIAFTARNLLTPSTANFVSGATNTAFNVYTNTDIQLADFARASAVAANYQFFKLKYLELSFLPDADTFAVGATSGKPYLYYMIDKGNTINIASTNVDIKNMGAKPIALDEKPIHIRWRPGVSLATEIVTSTGTTSAQMYKVSPWLNTDNSVTNPGFTPSDVCHYGIKFAVENNGQPLNYTATLTAHFAFKKPLAQTSSQTVGQGQGTNE